MPFSTPGSDRPASSLRVRRRPLSIWRWLATAGVGGLVLGALMAPVAPLTNPRDRPESAELPDAVRVAGVWYRAAGPAWPIDDGAMRAWRTSAGGETLYRPVGGGGGFAPGSPTRPGSVVYVRVAPNAYRPYAAEPRP